MTPYYKTDLGELYLGDALEILPTLPSNQARAIITDPPYGVGSVDKRLEGVREDYNLIPQIAPEFYRILQDNAVAIVFAGQKTYCETVKALEDAGFTIHQTLIWHRPNLVGGTNKSTFGFTSVYEQIIVAHKGRPGRPNRVEGLHNTDVLKYAMPQSNFKRDKRYHRHQKPLKLMEHLVLAYTNPGELIVDPFAGAGTTAMAAERHGRRWIAIEIEKGFVEIARARLTGVL